MALLSSEPVKVVWPAVAVYSNALKAPVVETEPKDNVPLPFVFSASPFEPSAVGKLNATPLDIKGVKQLIDCRPFIKQGKIIALLQAKEQYKIYTNVS